MIYVCNSIIKPFANLRLNCELGFIFTKTIFCHFASFIFDLAVLFVFLF